MTKTTGRRSRQDPAHNRSLAIRLVLKAHPTAKADDVVEKVKTEYGHDVSNTLVYLVRSKARQAKRLTRRSVTRTRVSNTHVQLEAIKIGRQFLNLAGSRQAATTILDALSD